MSRSPGVSSRRFVGHGVLGDFLPENLDEEAHGCDVRVASTANIPDLT